MNRWRLMLGGFLVSALSFGLVQAQEVAEAPSISPTKAVEPTFRAHAITLYDEAPKYPSGFPHFDYVNPEAPKGGTFRTASLTSGTFDSFHPYIAKGSPVKTGAIESLMVASQDEPFTQYGLLAEEVEWPLDRSWVTFYLNPLARWHDGKPVTADDVKWTFDTLVSKGAPVYRYYYASVERVEVIAERQVTFYFKEQNNRELPMIISQLPVLPKHYWAEHDFEKTTLEPPLGSGPYQIGEFQAGRYVVQERVKDYWGEHLPVRRGLNNFDRIRSDFYRDPTAGRLAIKAGKIDYLRENTAKVWATEYEGLKARDQGMLHKEVVPHEQPSGMQGMVFNTRKPYFSDWRVRKAISLAFDFEWANHKLFYDQYQRSYSYFSNSSMAATGLPTSEELVILEPFRDRLPARVFNEAFKPSKTDGSGWPRENLLQAKSLLEQAGWQVQDMELRNAKGEPLRFEIMLVSPTYERIMLPFARNLKKLGIEAKLRLVDSSQYVNRVRSFDFDAFITVLAQSDSPGNEQREYWSTSAADHPGSRNYSGIKDPVVDELIEGVITADSREQLITQVKALDRVLLAGYYVLPNWYLPAERILYWNQFSRPDVPINPGVSTARWWVDQSKADGLQAWRDQQGPEETGGQPDRWWSGVAGWGLWLLLLALGGYMLRRYLQSQRG